jgi:hypothetical protein
MTRITINSLKGNTNQRMGVKFSPAKYALAYRINREIFTPQVGESGILVHRKGTS